MGKRWTDIVASSILLVLAIIFFWRLFFPIPQLIVTPDYGRSDAWHFSFPTKYALSQSLTSYSLPLWRKDIGSGFPLFAEGQTGALFIPNLVLFFLFPPIPAYNLALTIAIATIGIGMYFLCRTVHLSSVGSLFASISIMFSALTLTQLPHITLLQGISMLPIVSLLSIQVATYQRKRDIGLLALCVAQQLYAGFPQASLLTYIFSGSIVLWHTYRQRHINVLIAWICAIILGISAGSLQLLPSWEFLRAGTDPRGFSPTTATAYSMPFIHLKSFFSPFAFGNPATGTYPPFYAFDGSIFWENTAYMGILPIILLGGSIFFLKKHRIIGIGWIFLLTTLILAAGKYGPTYLIYSIWPLNLFRVPSRFLWLSILSIALISGYVITNIQQSIRWKSSIRILLILLFIGHTVQLMQTWWSYHLILPAQQWIERPLTVRDIDNGKLFTIGEAVRHNDIMTKTGWTNSDPYVALRMGLSPDSNMLWEISQHSVYAGRYLKRPTLTDSLLGESITSDTKVATVSATRFLDMLSITHIISFIPLDAPSLLLDRTVWDASISASIYTNPTALPRAYFVHEATSAATVREAATILKHSTYIPGHTVLLEKHAIKQFPQFSQFLSPSSQPDRAQSITWDRDTHTTIRLQTTSQTDNILVLTDTYYPGWIATIDGIKTPILAANLSQRALYVPKGTHTIEMNYSPQSVTWGAYITIISSMIIMILMILPKRLEAFRTQKKSHEHAPHRQNIHHTS